jgi:hypothetical protein
MEEEEVLEVDRRAAVRMAVEDGGGVLSKELRYN